MTEDNMEDKTGSKDSFKNCSSIGLMWWTTLVVAVLAIPSLGFIIAKALPLRGFGELLIFILACWFCTYLGMRLMHNPKMSESFHPHKKP